MGKSEDNIAIVADWIIGGGAERVVEQLHKMYPEAPIYTSYCSDEWRSKLNGQVRTSWLQYWPFGAIRKYIGPLRILYFRFLNLKQYDTVISCTGNGEAKFVRVKKPAQHICYCFTPTHFYWRHYQTYLDNPGFGIFNPLAKLGLKILVTPLRKLDYRAAQKPDKFIAISSHIQSDIRKYYNRDSVIIHPPVDIERFKDIDKSSTKRTGFITIGRQTPYKKTDLIIKACNELKLPLTVVGRGPEHQKLKQLAGKTVQVLDDVSDQEVSDLLTRSKAFIFAAEEDFGIAPVEALAAGTPVIAYKAGGALDFVKEGVNGIFFDKQTTEDIENVVKDFNFSQIDEDNVKSSANKFSADHFKSKISDILEK